MSALCVIPARGGSKRIPRKNIKEFAGLPMIAHSIRAAQKSGVFSHIIVSTDDQEIAEAALAHGAEVPFVRPPEIADDFATTMDVMVHSVVASEEFFGETFPHVCCLYATAPFVQPQDLIFAREVLGKNEEVDFVVPVTSFAFPVQRALKKSETGLLRPVSKVDMQKRSQDLEETYHDTGQFYWGQRESWLDVLPLWERRVFPLILPHYLVQDIDTLEDWTRAEMMFEILERRGLLR